jgi:hypothetical protein
MPGYAHRLQLPRGNRAMTGARVLALLDLACGISYVEPSVPHVPGERGAERQGRERPLIGMDVCTRRQKEVR